MQSKSTSLVPGIQDGFTCPKKIGGQLGEVGGGGFGVGVVGGVSLKENIFAEQKCGPCWTCPNSTSVDAGSLGPASRLLCSGHLTSFYGGRRLLVTLMPWGLLWAVALWWVDIYPWINEGCHSVYTDQTCEGRDLGMPQGSFCDSSLTL